VLTAVGLCLQAGLVAVPHDADRHALRWHAYLWDPWFLVWGAFLLVALIRDASRPALADGDDES
jgi:hypothetical protein